MGILDSAKTVAESEPYVRALVYGDPGTGKTVFAAKFPKPFIIDVENGTSSLRNHDELSGVKVHNLGKFDEMQEIFNDFRSGGGMEFETVVIDSLSALQQKHLAEVIERDKSRDSKVPTLLDYKANTAVMQRLLIAFRDLPKNLVITAHSTFDKDDNDGRMYIRPDVTPRLSQTVVGLLDVIGWMHTGEGEKEGKQYLQIRPSRKVVAKTRIGGLEPIIEAPDPTVFFKSKINSAVTL